jgi:Ca2+-binding RTX toxin-like protein
MAMVDTIDYALLATRVYAASFDNRTGVPAGWTELTWQADYNSSGFSAGAYRQGSEVVIAYTGTNQTLDWFLGNTAGLGLLPAPQVFEAMRFYLDVKAANPDATSFTFTGHSLGGGLASLMAVFFDKQATVFDEAPFQLSAINPVLLSSLEASLLLNGYTDLDFALYNASFGTMFPFRESNVSHIYLDGEILGTGRAIVPAIAGSETAVSMGSSTLDAMDRHTMTLLTAMLSNTQFALVIQQLPNLATYLLGSSWFGVADRRTADTIDLMSNFLRHQYGVEGVTPDGRLDHFAADMQQLVGIAGTARSNAAVRDALMIASMEYFYTKAASLTADKLFTMDSNGLHFKYSDIGATSYKSLPLLARAVESLLGPDGTGTYAQLVTQNAWHIQSGTAGMTWTAIGAENDAAIGGVQADTLNAGAGNDVLCGLGGDDTLAGGTGDDMLIGGTGNDILQGGTGYDTYVWHTGDGNDQIIDQREADGKFHGIIKIVNDQGQNVVVGGAYVQQGTSEVWVKTLADGSGNLTLTQDDAGVWTLTLTDGSALTLGGFKDGDFGIGLVEEGVDPGVGMTIGGDREPAKFYDENGDWYYKYDDLGNIITGRYGMDINGNIVYVSNAEPNRADTLYDSAGNDRVEGLGGNDVLNAFRGGDDIVDGGAGDDVGYGGAGADLLLGGSGSDAMIGGADDDRLYADQEQEILEAYLAGETGDGTGMRGDLLSGDAGDDQLYGGASNDVLAGGAGADTIYAGVGDDTIEGDCGFSGASSSWSVTRTITQEGDHSVYRRAYQNVWWYETASVEQGDDTIYAGAGADWVFAQGGNDFVDAGIGDDMVFGEAGDDIILGQGGNDILNGDSRSTQAEDQGDDYLDGGEGNDKIFGNGGADILLGGMGNDELYGDASDLPAEAHGDDYLDGGDGNDYLAGYGGDDTLLGGADDDTLFGVEGNDSLDGGTGADELQGGEGDDFLSGEEEDDTLFGQEGNDILTGGTGVDYLNGGSGDDTYVFAAGDSPMVVNDWFMTVEWLDDRQGLNTLALSSGYPLQLYYDGYGLTLQYGMDDYLYVIDGLLQASHYNVDMGAGAVSLRSLIAQQIDVPLFLEGSAAADILQGGLNDDVLIGNDGNDLLDGGAGNDTLAGGTGNDQLYGGAGNNTYLFNRGDGQDAIVDAEGFDTVSFGVGILSTDILVDRVGDQLILQIKDNGDQLTIVDHYAGGVEDQRIEQLEFADGEIWDQSRIQGMVPNHAPILATPLADQSFVEGEALTYILPENAFSDPDTDDTLTYTATTVDGGTLPDWLSFNPITREFTGTPPVDSIGTVSVKVVATDPEGLFVSDLFNLEVRAQDPPLLGTPGDDTLTGTAGNDILQGMAGNDLLIGGAGNDTYLYNVGDGVDTIVDTALPGEGNTLVFGEGITADDLSLGLGSLLIRTGDEGDAIHIENFNPNDVYGDHAIETFRFADGTRSLSDLAVISN